ncbi:MAG: tRNA (cytidine(34)-2'-O)-methyltransferase [Oscillospiraceae bacterium]|nr:tRNA (cytidine(34)-2'-O)-methyltransferase [Oscillospiraceae bacterium]
MLHIVLVEPEIPQNTGNIARTCAAIGARLHVVKPLFEISDKTVKRAGLDYWQHLDLEMHDSLEAFLAKYGAQQLYFVETGTDTLYSDICFPSETFLLFGKETLGLPKDLLASGKGTTITIPTLQHIRSLNLSNAVAVVAYEVVRQQNLFTGCS